MLQDAIWADTERLESDEEYADTAVKLIQGAILGWIDQRDDPQAAADAVTAAGSTLGTSHQLWMANEINKLIWPSTSGVGHINEDQWNATVEMALATKNQDGATGHHDRSARVGVHERVRRPGARGAEGRRCRRHGRGLRARRGRTPRGRQLDPNSGGRVAPRSGRIETGLDTGLAALLDHRSQERQRSHDRQPHRGPRRTRARARQGPRLPLLVGAVATLDAHDRERPRARGSGTTPDASTSTSPASS